MIEYVLCIALNPTNKKTVLTFKNRGPSEVVGKWNFPGGKREPKESIFEAAARELFEETGLVCQAADFQLYNHRLGEDFSLHSLLVYTEAVEQAYTKEDEEIRVWDLQAAVDASVQDPQQFAPGMGFTLKSLLKL